ncbi:class I SAM-dependent methyltransferase [Fusibacter sp. JL216-2]|uniref:class I SAM-dependent methyltransferase n=1 Tax=Fusibacter sp. JL216-2 TaxID=3071453 RepID=UPI003D32D3CD
MKSTSWEKYWGSEEKLDHWKVPEPEVIDFIKEVKEIHSTASVLDLGCGLGRHSIAFAEEGFDVQAVDFSKEALEQLDDIGKKNDLQIQIRIGDYRSTLYENESFEIVLSYNVLYHGSRDEFQNSIKKCYNYLKPNGIFMFTCVTRDDDKYGNGKMKAPHTYLSENSVHPGDIHYFSSEEDLNEMLCMFKAISLSRKEHEWIYKGEKRFSSYWVVVARK